MITFVERPGYPNIIDVLDDGDPAGQIKSIQSEDGTYYDGMINVYGHITTPGGYDLDDLKHVIQYQFDSVDPNNPFPE